MRTELQKIELELRREATATEFDRKFNLVHIPTIERLIKVDGKYQIKECDCYFCKLGKT